MVHHDIWDYDASTQPTMINVETGGKKVEGIVQANKDGYAYFVNAATGQPVFPIEEKPVPQNTKLEATYPTQPIPSDAAVRPAEGRRRRIEDNRGRARSIGEHCQGSRAEHRHRSRLRRQRVSSRPSQNMVKRRSTKLGCLDWRTGRQRVLRSRNRRLLRMLAFSARGGSRSSRKRRTRPEGKRTAQARVDYRAAFRGPSQGATSPRTTCRPGRSSGRMNCRTSATPRYHGHKGRRRYLPAPMKAK